MNQYIITEEQLQNIMEGDIADLRAVRSHPYNRTCLTCGKRNNCKLINSYSVCWEEELRQAGEP